MAHSYDVFDAAGTHTCSCQNNGGLASNCSKRHCEIDIHIGATKSCIFIILIYFAIKTPESGKIQDLVERMSISQYILLEVTNARKLLPHGQNFGLGCSKSGYNPWIIQK
jgi:hypothetical protein